MGKYGKVKYGKVWESMGKSPRFASYSPNPPILLGAMDIGSVRSARLQVRQTLLFQDARHWPVWSTGSTVLWTALDGSCRT